MQIIHTKLCTDSKDHVLRINKNIVMVTKKSYKKAYKMMWQCVIS